MIKKIKKIIIIFNRIIKIFVILFKIIYYISIFGVILEFLFGGSLKDSEPVSYTHLDVYKRQGIFKFKRFRNGFNNDNKYYKK